MKKYILLLFFLASACSTINAPSASVLTSSNCELPCWNGISPGTTSPEEAYQKLQNIVSVNLNSKNSINQPWKMFSGTITFAIHLKEFGIGEEVDGEIYIIVDRVTVLKLFRNLNLTFEDGIQKFGEPEIIITVPLYHGGEYSLVAIYPSRGVAFESILYSNNVEKETEIFAITSFDINRYENLLEAGMFSDGFYESVDSKIIMYPWKSYGNVEELYNPDSP